MFSYNRPWLFTTTCAGALLLGASLAAAQTAPVAVRPGVTLPPGSKVLNPGGRLQIVRPPSGLVTAPGRAHTNVEIVVPRGGYAGINPPGGASPDVGGPPQPRFLFATPASLACDYGLVAVTFNCNPNFTTTNSALGSKAIAIVDAYDLTSATTDLIKFDQQFGLPATTFQKIYGTGSPTTCANGPAVSSASGTGWDVEEDLDIEYAHAMAPKARLFLVEAASSSYSDLLNAERVAAACVSAVGGGMISNSWGSAEYSGETANDSAFVKSGIVFFASTGDDTYPSWPAVSPNLVAVGGTTLANDPNTGAFNGQQSWFPNPDLFGYSSGYYTLGEGAGTSVYEPIPSWQSAESKVLGNFRGIPDVSAVADPETGVWIYNTLSYAGWTVIGGTSVASPVMAGITNASGNFYNSSAAYLTVLYGLGKQHKVQSYFGKMDSGDCGVPTSYNFSPPFKGYYITFGGSIVPQKQKVRHRRLLERVRRLGLPDQRQPAVGRLTVRPDEVA